MCCSLSVLYCCFYFFVLVATPLSHVLTAVAVLFFSCSFSHLSVISLFPDSTMLCQLSVPCLTWKLKTLWSSGHTWALLASRSIPCITNPCVICILCCGVLGAPVCFTLISLLYAVECLESLFSCVTNACLLAACTPKAAGCMLQPSLFLPSLLLLWLWKLFPELFHVYISSYAQVPSFLTCVLSCFRYCKI